MFAERNSEPAAFSPLFLAARRKRAVLAACAPVFLAALPAHGQLNLNESLNWSGYSVSVAANSGNDFTDVSATFVIPTLKAPSSGTAFSGYWVGLDGAAGASDPTVEQCGISADITSGGTTSYTAWYEFAPAAQNIVSLTVNPGDTIFADVTYEPTESSSGNYAYLFNIEDETTGKSWNNGDMPEDTSSNDNRTSAEWIAEAPTILVDGNDAQSTMANFASVTFSNSVAALNGGSDQSAGSLSPTEWEMLATKTGPVVAVPSNIDSNGQTFTNYYASALPSLIWNDASGNKQWNITSANWTDGSTVVYGDGVSVTFNDSNGSSGNYAVTLNTTVSPGSMTVNNGSGNYVISGSGNIAGTGALTKMGGDLLTLDTVNSYSGGTNVTAGTLVVGVNGALPSGAVSVTGGTLQLGTSTGLATITSLAISGSGKFDVNNNHVVINYSGGSDPISSIAALLKTGYAGGAWNGAGGIVSTAAAATSSSYGLGYADSADSGNPAGLAANTIEIKYTLLGDANLDGVVNGTDFGIVAADFNKGVTGWDKGDFFYANIVNASDFGVLAANFNKGDSGASVGEPAIDDPAIVAFAQANGLMADVPEPAICPLAVIVAAGIVARRRRSTSPVRRCF